MKIPNRELQEKVFGYYTEELPPSGSIKAKAYELLSNPLITNEHIEKMAQTFKRMKMQIEQNIVQPLIEEQARRQ